MKKTTLLFFMFFISMCGFAQLTPPEGFEGTWATQTSSGAGGPAGWAIVNAGAPGSTVWWIQGNGGSTQPAYEGTHSAFLDRENVLAGTTSEDWLITKSFVLPVNPQLHFYSRLFFNADQLTQFKIYIAPATANTIAEQTNTANFTNIVNWTELQLNPVQTSWTEKTVDLTVPSTIAPGTNVYIAFVMLGDNGERWAIDQVSVTAKCLDPTTLTGNNFTMTTANLSWANPSGATEWEVEVLPQTGTPTGTGVTYTGSLPFVAGSAGSGVTLTEDTDYKYYVRAHCSDGGVSNWVGPYNFSTVALGESCGAPIVIGALPYSTTDNTSNYADSNYEGSPGATGCGVTYGYLDGNDVVYSFTPTATGVVSLDLTGIGIYTGLFVYDSCANIGISCVGGGITDYLGGPISIPTLSVTANVTYYVVISTYGFPQTTAYNLVIQQVNCLKPVGMPTTNIGMTSADLSWTNPSNATSWQLVVQTPNAGIPSGAGTTVTDNTELTVTTTAAGANLTTATPYEYYVRADCGNGTFSAWAGPYQFNTMICEAADQCTYTFVLTDSYGDGWNGGLMTVSQNGITIATLGSTFTTGTGPISIPVQVCNGFPIQLAWTTAGSYPGEMGISIQNSFSQTFYTKPSGTGSAGTTLYTGTVDCDTPMCLPPTNLTATNITNTSAQLGWAGQPTGSWEYYVTEAGGAAPTEADAIATSTNPVTVAIEEATNYVFYVRMVCSDDQNSTWAGPFAFSSDSCPESEQCNYTFVMTSDWGGGWYGASMVISQNGVNVATIGSTFTTGSTQSVTVPLCTGIPFQVFWANGGSYYYQVGLQVINGFSQTLYTLLPNGGTPNTVLYTSTADCLVPACLPPTGLYTDNETTTTADLGWDGPATGSWEYYIVNADLNEAAPTDASTPTGATTTNPAIGVGPLLPSTNYEYYVRIVCANDTESSWAGPFAFHTQVCEATDQCVYTFEMQSQNGWGWEGNTMTIYQGGVPVAVIGGDFDWSSDDTYSQTTSVSLCADTEISIFWNTTGYDASDKGLIVYSPFMEDIYVKPFGTGQQGSTLYTGIPSCDAPLCPKPQQLEVVGDPALTSVSVDWDEMGSATQWEVTVVAYQADAPDPTAPIVTTQLTSAHPYTVTPLESGTTYSVYVRAICGGDNGNSTWSGPLTFTTALANDDCDGAIDLPVNPGADCVDMVTGTVTGSTGSGLVPSCNSWSTIEYDAWFSFVATGTSHAVTVNNQTGAYFNFVVYEGDNCGALTEFSCGYNNFNVLEGLTPGNTYYVMVYTTYMNSPTTITGFDVCVTTPEPPITTSTTQYTVEELVQDVFIGSECALVTNILSSTGTAYGLNGIGSFDQNGSGFPFESGVVLVSSAVSSVPGPNDDTINGDFQWAGDTDLEDIVGLAPGNSHDASWIQFDFSPLIDMPLSFDFIFASEEYGVPSFECFYSDAFAFILTDLEGDQPEENLAVLPGTNIPILVTNVHPYNDQCGAANETLFDQYNGPLSPINLNGQLVPITATSSYTLVANHQYRMKMVIANKGDHSLSSAVFLLAGSFDLGEIDLGLDMTVEDGTAICAQADVILNSNLDPDDHTFIWLQDGVVMEGEDGPTLTVTEPGEYTLQAPVNDTECVRTGHVNVEFYPLVEVITADPVDLTACDADGYATFDLTQNTATILAGLDATLYTVTYYPTEADAQAQTNAIAAPTAFTNTTQFTQTIWTRIVINAGQCFAIKSFDLIIQDLTPAFTITDDFTLCEGSTQDIVVTLNAPNPDATYSWTLDGADLGVTTGTVTADAAGAYEVTITNSGCTATAIVNVLVVPMPVADDPIDVTACDSYVLPALTAGNAYYTETNGGGVQLFADEVINSSQDIYVFASNGAAGCIAENVFTVTIAPSPVIVAAEVVNIVNCDTYTLPALTVGSYYTAADGAGTLIPAGTVYNTAGVETVYVYAQTGTTPNCTASASFTVTITTTPVADDPADVAVCDSYTLPALSAGNVYYSGPGATGNVVPAGTVIIDNTTLYIVAQAAGNAACTSENPFAIVIVPSPEVSLTQGCNDNDEYELSVVFEDELYNSDNATFAWSGPENGTGAALVITTPGTYVVTVTPINSAVCPVEATIVVDETSCKVQKGISPNNDGMNDSFDLSGLDVRKLEIFNRYGKEVYSKSGYRNEWFGQTDGGDELPTGTYFYMFERNNGETQTGWIYVNRQDK